MHAFRGKLLLILTKTKRKHVLMHYATVAAPIQNLELGKSKENYPGPVETAVQSSFLSHPNSICRAKNTDSI